MPEKTRTKESRPTNGSLVVRTTSATSGPSGSHAHWPERLTGWRIDRRYRRRCWGRESLLEQLEEPLNAHPSRGVRGNDGEEPRSGDRRPQIGQDDVQVDRFAAQVPVEQRLVLGLLDDRLDQRVPVLLDDRGFGLVRVP